VIPAAPTSRHTTHGADPRARARDAPARKIPPVLIGGKLKELPVRLSRRQHWHAKLAPAAASVAIEPSGTGFSAGKSEDSALILFRDRDYT
jgi:hypothetical protein